MFYIWGSLHGIEWVGCGCESENFPKTHFGDGILRCKKTIEGLKCSSIESATHGGKPFPPSPSNSLPPFPKKSTLCETRQRATD